MARLGKVSACMFCGEMPCVCNAPAKKQPKPKPAKVAQAPAEKFQAPVEEFTPPPRRSGPFAGFVHPSTALAEQAGQPNEHIEKLRAESEVRAVEKEESDDSYLRALAVIRDSGILTPESQARVERLVPRTYPPDALEKTKSWKERHSVR